MSGSEGRIRSSGSMGGTEGTQVSTGERVIEGKPHEPLEGEKQRAQPTTGAVDMNPGEPAVPFRPQPGEK